ncbi:MAG: hypothetical protein AMXMBFR77_27840 [Phycisphaerales bacterium]
MSRGLRALDDELLDDVVAGLRAKVPPPASPSAAVVRDVCCATGLTRVRLAEVLGVHRGTVNRWWDGKAEPSAPVLRTLRYLMAHPDRLADYRAA